MKKQFYINHASHLKLNKEGLADLGQGKIIPTQAEE